MSSVMIFSRKFNGVDVLGKGSKVAVLYANDGTQFWLRLRLAGPV